jgi:hypothetical protein
MLEIHDKHSEVLAKQQEGTEASLIISMFNNTVQIFHFALFNISLLTSVTNSRRGASLRHGADAFWLSHCVQHLGVSKLNSLLSPLGTSATN